MAGTNSVVEAEGDNIIEIKDVTFTYLGEKGPALKNANLTIKRGDFVLVLGPSSAGKSTLLNLLNGSVPHIFEGTLEGEVIVDGKNTIEHQVSQLATSVGLVFQDPESQLVNIFVKDEVYFGPENLLKPIEEIKANAMEAMRLVGLDNLMDRDVFQLSGGQKQKVAIAAVLSMRPKVIALDQPTANLDPKTKVEVFQILAKLNRELGITVVVVEHDVDDLAGLINKVVVMKDGSILASGTPREVFSKNFKEFSEELGLWVPQVSELAQATGKMIPFLALPLTVEEALEPVRTAVSSAEREGTLLKGSPDGARKDTAPRGLPLIEVKDLSFTYAVNGVKALDRVNLTVYPGDFLAIVGKNGSGKSTLAKTLMKINQIERGKVFIKGKDINDLTLYELTKTIGYVFQNPDHQFVADTVYDEVAYSLRVRNIPEDEVKERVMEVLDLFNLAGHLEVSPFALSMGQRRLLSVATMLVVDQDAIILDEPTIGQDQASSNHLMGYLKRLNEQGKAIIIITHDMRLTSQWVERVFVMSESHVLFDGHISEVFNDPQLLEKASLLPPPLVVLMQRLRETHRDLPASILTVEQFTSLFARRAG